MNNQLTPEQLANIEALEAQLEVLLNEKPEMRTYQNALKLKLMHLDNPADRMVVIAEEAKKNIKRLDAALKELKNILEGKNAE